MDSVTLKLKKNQDRRLRAGHLWVYSNEIDTAQSPLKGLEPGMPIDLVNAQGRWLASGYVNPNSLISARVVSRDPEHRLGQALISHRLNIALSLRERLYREPFYRLVFAESDGLPGLVVDRYGDYLSVQLNTAGMAVQREAVLAALDKLLSPKAVVLRNDSRARVVEGLSQEVEVIGELPEQVEVREGGARFRVDLVHGQKTGWFFDQAANRDRMLPFVEGARVLDVCSYVGAWGVRAALAGAAAVTCVDSSATALSQVEANAALNGVVDKVGTLKSDAFNALRELKQQGERFDVIVLDPPAFIKRRKDFKEGALAYRRLNEAAMGLLGRDGILISASCSFHMRQETFLEMLQAAARHGDRFVQLLAQGSQGPDHPVHPAIPETAYLKASWLRVLPSQ